MLFREVAHIFQQIEKTNSRLEMTEKYAELINKTDEKVIDKVIYLSKGELAPSYKGIVIGLGERFVLQAIAISTGYNLSEVEKRYKKIGDLGDVASEFILKRKQQSLFHEELTVEGVYSSFLKIAKTHGEKSQQIKINYLVDLLNSALPEEAIFICRFLVGKLRLGVGDPTILDALSWSKKGDKSLREKIEQAYNLCSDLGYIAKLFVKDAKLIENIKIVPFIPLRPALAERENSIKSILSRLGLCAIDSKYDGFRMQIHKKDEAVKIFSRRLDDMTHMFPEIVKAVQELEAKELIFEGEALAYDLKKERFLSFQQTMKRRRKYGVKEFSKTTPLRLFLFDILYLDSRELIKDPYSKRREILEDLIITHAQYTNNKTLSLSEQIISDNEKQIKEFFEDRLEKGLEGIIAKDLNAPYSAGKRGFSWIKLKKSYGLMVDTVDCVILGYFVGKGHRAEFEFGGLLVGTYNENLDKFETVAKIGSGFSEEEMISLREMLKKEIVKEKPKNVDSYIEPDYWVVPKYVISVAYDDITKSPSHTCYEQQGQGLALRFPRMKQIRTDKDIYEATTSFEIYEMYNLIKGVENNGI